MSKKPGKFDHLLHQSPAASGAARMQPIPKDVVFSRIDNAADECRRFVRSLERRYELKKREVSGILRQMVGEVEQPNYQTQHLIDALQGRDSTTCDPPASAPEFWKQRDLNRKENAPAFITRVYAQWLGRGLERRHLATLDPDLYKALSVWLARHPDDPIVAQLPAQYEKLDELIEQLSAEYPLDVLRKLGYAIDARMRRSEK